MGRLLIKFPTRSRPEKFQRVLTRYRDFLSGRHDVQFVITCDVIDPRMNNRRIRRWLADFARTVPLSVHYGWSWTKIQAVNADLAGRRADALLVASDDMNPQVEGYDDRIFARLAERFPDFRGALKFDDGFRKDDLMTYPVLGWPLYEAFGYIYHPKYWSVYCDNEQTESCQALNCLAVVPEMLFRHEWTPQPVDLLHRRNENHWIKRKDRRLFAKRRLAGFDTRRVREALYGQTG
jgi:hypothetical protein